MRIAMIGDSDAGKTTYMAMMYEAMVEGFKGFRLAAANPRHGAELLADAEHIHREKYPPPSSRRELHEFKLSLKGAVFFDFAWSDYRGGAITERAIEADVQAVHADLRAADGIVVFADARRFADDADALDLARRMTFLLQRAVGERSSPVPVVLAYTKADLVRGRREWERAVRPLTALQHTVDTSPNARAVTVRVSCGRRPKNVHVPVLWCLSHHVIGKVAELESRRDYWTRLEAEAQSKAWFGNSIKAWLNDTKSEARIAREHAGQAAAAYREMLPLQGPAEQLDKLVRRHLRQR